MTATRCRYWSSVFKPSSQKRPPLEALWTKPFVVMNHRPSGPSGPNYVNLIPAGKEATLRPGGPPKPLLCWILNITVGNSRGEKETKGWRGKWSLRSFFTCIFGRVKVNRCRLWFWSSLIFSPWYTLALNDLETVRSRWIILNMIGLRILLLSLIYLTVHIPYCVEMKSLWVYLVEILLFRGTLKFFTVPKFYGSYFC